MPPYKAERTLIGTDIEGSQKTEVVPARIPGFTSGNVTPPDPEHDWQEERPVGGTRELHDQVEGQRSFEGGSMTLHPYDGWPIAWVLGAESVGGGTDVDGDGAVDYYTHTLTANNSDPPVTATMEWTYIGASGQNDFVRRFLGCFPTSGEITQNNEGIMEVSVEHQALGVDPQTPDTTFTDVRPLPDRDAWKFQDAISDLTMFGTSFAEVNDFSLQMQTGSEPQYYVESSEAPEPYEATYGNAEYTLNATINVTDTSLYSELINPTAGGFSANMTFEKQHTQYEQLDIQCDNCRLESAPHDIPESGPVEVDVSIIPGTVTITVQDTESGGTGYLAAGTAA